MERTTEDDAFWAGWASAAFTPERPTPLGGYGARTGLSTGTHDPVRCQALALGTPDRPVVLVVADLVAVSAAEVEAVRDAVRAHAPTSELWLTATHTHSAPDLGAGGEAVAHARARFLDAATQAAREAIAAMAPARLRYAHGVVDAVGGRRNSGGADVGPAGEPLPLDVLILERGGEGQSGGERALLAVLPCHATVLGAANLEVSADLFGAIRTMLLDTGAPTLAWAAVAQGAAGDVSTRRTRRAQTFAEAARLGSVVAEAVHRLATEARPVRVDVVRTGREVLALRPKPAEAAAVLEARREAARAALAAAQGDGDEVARRMAETALEGAEAEAQRNRLLGRWAIAGEIAAIALGDLVLAAVPGELYLELGERLRAALGGHAVVLGYANGYVGYLPPAEAYAADDYEPRIALLAPGEAEAIVDRLAALAEAVRPRVARVAAGGDVVATLERKIVTAIDAALAGQRAALDAAAAIVAATIARGGIVHTFGTGHSHMLAEEIYSRAGGLANVNAIQPSVLQLYEHAIASGAWERLSGAARIALEYAAIDPERDCLVVISNSGRNAAPVEAAEWARDRHMPVIAITSLAHSRSVPSLSPSGRRLFEVADVVLDNGGVPGDAALGLRAGDATAVEVAPLSTICGAAVVQTVVALAVGRCLTDGVAAPVIRSGNVPGASEDNARMLASYQGALPPIYGRYRARVERAGREA